MTIQSKAPSINSPSLRFSEYSDNWEVRQLSQVAKFFSGGTPVSTNKQYYQGNIPFIKSGEISKTKTEHNISQEGLESSSAKMVESGDLLYALYGATSGEVAISKIDGAINQAILCIRTDQNKNWLLNYLKHNKNRIISKYLQGGQGNLSADIIKKLEIRFPKLAEQQKIASFLTITDSWLDNLRSQKSSLESYKKSIMQKIFSQEIRFKDENGKVYPEWEEKEIGDFIYFLSDYTANGSFASLKENVKYYSTVNYAVLVRTTDLEKNVFKPERFTDEKGYKFLKKTSLFGGELIMSNVGNIGKVYKAPLYSGFMTLAPNTYVIRFDDKTSQEYMYQWMRTDTFLKKALSMVGGGGLMAINKSNLRSIDGIFPQSLVEQQKIADFLTSIDESIESKQDQITKALLWKKGLMQQMFV